MVWLEITSSSEVLKVSAGPMSVRVRSNTIENLRHLDRLGLENHGQETGGNSVSRGQQVLGLNQVLIDIRSVLAP
jgi:hypothetical protein